MARGRFSRGMLALLLLLALEQLALAGGPRWVTGPPYFTTSSKPVVWYIDNPVYFTDPADLSPYVSHAAADALVAAAAAVWNVPTSALVLGQGGSLAEHVSGDSVYLGSAGLVFPSDVSATNYAAIPIAVVYDTDGSVTDLLLGQGASDPENCPHAGVTESVDSITPAGTIQHALLILNGRCTGPAAAQQTQMQYQLMRAFGRVLGLGWSQLNDNVFTGSPTPTTEESLKWPIMHPIDIVCGAYTYQCVPSPFTLRPDDVASISQLYFIARGTAPMGKVDTLAAASSITGVMKFGDGQGMQGMNLTVRRADPVTPFLEDAPVVSAVSGTLFRWNNGNPVTGPAARTVAASMGYNNAPLEGQFKLGYIPLLGNVRVPGTVVHLQDAYISSEAINPLYTGEYGIGPYQAATVTPSGPAFPWRDNGVVAYESNDYTWPVPGSALTCDASGLGTAAAPVAVAASGWWMNVLCGYGASEWELLSVQANHSVTVEVTALDEQGEVTETKVQPLIGVWNQADPVGALPTVAAAGSPFNSIAAGLTLLNFNTPASTNLRLVIADQRGDGRPDYNFRARVLYLDSLTPATAEAGGGLVLLSGMGFRPGNTVTVDGVAAPVLASTATTMLVVAPAFASLPTGSSLAADVGVVDSATGGSTYIYGGLAYPASAVPTQSPSLTLLTPNFYVAAGQPVTLHPQASLSSAGTVGSGIAVTWSSVAPVLSFPTGVVSVADQTGIANIPVIVAPLSPGVQVLGSACAWGNACGDFTVSAIDPALWRVVAVEGTAQNVSQSSILQPIVFQVTDGFGHPVIGAPVAISQTLTNWQVCPAQGPCPASAVYGSSQAAAVSNANGLVTVTPQQLTGSPEITSVAVSAGSNGFASAAVSKHP